MAVGAILCLIGGAIAIAMGGDKGSIEGFWVQEYKDIAVLGI